MMVNCKHLQTKVMYLVRQVAHAALELNVVCVRRDCKLICLLTSD